MGSSPGPSGCENGSAPSAVARATVSAAEAWAVGEIDNVALYDELLVKADDARLVTVLGNLRRASLESHLPLFEAAAAAGGTLDEMPAHTP